ncbi:L-asparagine oxygenase [Kitasatospora sp. MAA4]|uniref:guanitoxin biosynthesis L-enduracididine beta-hydroxylase GntD n=1 Tax=Kitasatospora sp. MAA4 TaxID=3035093 RepID=UPI002475C14D|nr:guanitoxin biosynthesis L-enduracididine beta-hydroxylase GntD [Kitasatospora sp. MAA4]MDH6131811.1 L-asparagine oxygenase [Kitasatospora sp. MAA4]
MLHFTLSPEERDQARAAVAGLASELDELDARADRSGTGFFRALPVAARRLPERLLRFLEAFRREEPAGGFVLSGWTVVDDELGPTPAHWRRPAGTAGTASVHELYLVLVASALGDVFAWSTVQDGSLVQDLMPVRGEEWEKNAGSSASVLDLHNEDAFSALRCDYLGLLCLRNDDRVPTVYAPFDPAGLSREQRRILSEPRYLLAPDEEHLRRAAERGEEPPAPTRTGVLFGGDSAPYLAFDEYFVETDPEDAEARAALAALTDQLRRSRSDVALAPGELLIVDNYRAVHGRQPFPARYDGRDRWLKRVGVTRDLRRSRAARADVGSPVVLTGLAG